MAIVRVLVIRAAGINCDQETLFAWQSVGAMADLLHVKRLIENPAALDQYQILTIPGGFSYGDDIASGRILGNQLTNHLGDKLRAFVDRGGLILGICNGFQVLVRAGLLPGPDCPVQATVTLNDSGRYEDRWISLRADATNCPFLAPGELFNLPVAHGEGRVAIDGGAANLPAFEAAGRIALRYISDRGSPPVYPENPNGSIGNAAGLIDATGRILGLMPHPERAIHPLQFPGHIRDSSIEKSGLKIFQNAIRNLS